MLSRTATAKAAPEPRERDRARVVAFLGARGGSGTSTLALNTAVVLHAGGQDVILAEMNPGRGSMALDLNLPNPVGLSNLLIRSLKDIHLRSIDGELVTHRTGVRLLLASSRPKESELEQAVPADGGRGAGTWRRWRRSSWSTSAPDCARTCMPLANIADRVILVSEPVYPSNTIARNLIDELSASGLGRHRISLALLTPRAHESPDPVAADGRRPGGRSGWARLAGARASPPGGPEWRPTCPASPGHTGG